MASAPSSSAPGRRASGACGVEALLAACGVALPGPGAAGRHPDLEWARSGAMALSGLAEGPPLLAPAPLAARARETGEALRALSGSEALAQLDAAALLGEKAALFDLRRQGPRSPSGACRLLEAADGWLALNLARPDDVALLPAWLGEGHASDPWAFAAQRVARGSVDALVERGRLLGLPLAPASDPPRQSPPWARIAVRGPARARGAAQLPLVMDLSSLWAGPLCTHLLQLAGARVVKLESARRPDGARFGPAAFLDLLHAGKQSVALDFASPEGRARLRRLLERADIVVESARPRALAQLGIEAEELVRRVPGLTWVSITGYGRRAPGANWVAFGDDAAVAAGLAAATGAPDGPPIFCGDAIADPLAGLHAALVALASFRSGGGHLLDVALRDVVAHLLVRGGSTREARVERAGSGWEVAQGSARQAVLPPRARATRGRARSLGADTEAVLAELGARC
jgi:hypothetical protein